MVLFKVAKIFFKRKSHTSPLRIGLRANTKPKTASSALRLAPYLLIVPIIVFQGKISLQHCQWVGGLLTAPAALSLTGCISTSPAIPNIYIVSLRPNHNTTDVPTQVRIGYFGMSAAPLFLPLIFPAPADRCFFPPQESAASMKTAPAASRRRAAPSRR